MSKWKCDICNSEFENFHAQGFNHKIYCPLCYFKKENQELKDRIDKAIEKIQLLIDIGFDYDGFNKTDSLKTLIDELVNLARDSREILKGDKE